MKKLFLIFLSVLTCFAAQNGVSYNTTNKRVSQTDLIYIAADITVTGAFHATNNYISLSGQTNRLTMSGGQLLLDGVPLGSGGGGDTIWTNDAGSIELISNPAALSFDTLGNAAFAGSLTLSTNIVVLNPQVVDGASAVAFKFDTENALSTTGAKLATFGNGGTETTIVGLFGGYYVGPQTHNWWGGASKGDVLIAYNDEFTSGDSHARTFFLEQDNSDPDLNTFASLVANVNSGSAAFALQGQDADGVNGNLVVKVINGLPELRMNDGVIGTVLLVAPCIADSSTPYTFDTSLAHTSGNLLVVKNNSTNIFEVGFEGNATLSSFNGTGALFVESGGSEGQYRATSIGLQLSGPGGVSINPIAPNGNTAFSFTTSGGHPIVDSIFVIGNNGVGTFTVYGDSAFQTEAPATEAQAKVLIGDKNTGVGLAIDPLSYIPINLNGTTYKLGIVQ